MKLRVLLIFSVIILLFTKTHAHHGDFLVIDNVKLHETETSWICHFQVENIKCVELKGVKIEFVINGSSVLERDYLLIKSDIKTFDEYFELPKKALDPKVDLIQIEVTELFDVRDDWGGWDSQNLNKQVNTLFSEFYVDAPWRMKKTDELGNVQSIPLHFFLHDADAVVGSSPQLDYINIQLKNASSSSWQNVLTYNTIPDVDFRNMFSCVSPSDPGFSIQEFDMTSFSASSSYTMDFDAETDIFGGDYVSVDAEFFYFTFNIPASALAAMEDIIDVYVLVAYDNTLFTNEEFGMRIFRSDDALPSQDGWYRGDTHLHSIYTQNDAELGLPLCATKEAAKLIGLDWITSTDHTSDYDNYGDGNILNNWGRIQTEVAQWNAADPSMIYIAGQEVAVNNSDDNLVHMLAYPSYDDPMSLPFLGDGDGDVSGTSVSVDDALYHLNSANGFAYAAHPFATEDKLPSIPVDGGIWNLSEDGFAVNGDNFPETGGNIIANDLSLSSDVLNSGYGKLIKDALVGGQIWNCRVNLNVSGTSGNEVDGWDVMNNSTAMSQVDTASTSYHFKKFRQGQEIVNHINQLGLSLKNMDNFYQNWKMYFSGGSDAHGSFNFSNTGNFAGFGGIDDNAVGKINTLVYCPEGPGLDGSNILKGLSQGNITMSDGPILTIGISSDGDNQVNEILMGEDAIVDHYMIDNYYLNFNYTTTPEFGEVTHLMIALSTEDQEYRKYLSLDSLMGDQVVSYKLIDLVDTLLGTGNFIMDDYMYVRAELQTFRDYNAVSGIYQTDFGFYHSVSNPIWFSISDDNKVPDGVFNLDIFPNPATEGFQIQVELAGVNDIVINIYNSIGQVVSSEIRQVNNSITIEYPTADLRLSKGVYTIKAMLGEQNVSAKLIQL